MVHYFYYFSLAGSDLSLGKRLGSPRQVSIQTQETVNLSHTQDVIIWHVFRLKVEAGGNTQAQGEYPVKPESNQELPFLWAPEPQTDLQSQDKQSILCAAAS